MPLYADQAHDILFELAKARHECVSIKIGRQFTKVSGKVEEVAKSSSASTESCSESWES